MPDASNIKPFHLLSCFDRFEDHTSYSYLWYKKREALFSSGALCDSPWPSYYDDSRLSHRTAHLSADVGLESIVVVRQIRQHKLRHRRLALGEHAHQCTQKRNTHHPHQHVSRVASARRGNCAKRRLGCLAACGGGAVRAVWRGWWVGVQ